MKSSRPDNKKWLIAAALIVGALIIYLLIKGPPRPVSAPRSGGVTILYTCGLHGKIHTSTARESVDGVTPADLTRVFMNISRLKAEAENRGEPVFIIDLGNSLSGPVSLSRLMAGRPALRLMAEFPTDAILLGEQDYRLGAGAIKQLPQTITLLGFPDLFPGGGSAKNSPLKSSVTIRKGNLEAEFFALPEKQQEIPGLIKLLKNSDAPLKIVLSPTARPKLPSEQLDSIDLVIPSTFYGSTNYNGISFYNGVPVAPPVNSRFHLGKVRLIQKPGGGKWQAEAAIVPVIPTDKLAPGAVMNVVLDAQHNFQVIYRGLFTDLKENVIFHCPPGLDRKGLLKITAMIICKTTGADGALLDTNQFRVPACCTWGSRDILDSPGPGFNLELVMINTPEINKLPRINGLFIYLRSLPAGKKVTLAVDSRLKGRLPGEIFKNPRSWPYSGGFILLDGLRRDPVKYYKASSIPSQAMTGILDSIKKLPSQQSLRVIEKAPAREKVEGLILLGMILCRDGNPRESLQLWKKALALKPGDIEIAGLLKTARGLGPKPPKPTPPKTAVSQWPRFRGNNQGSGLASVSGPDKPLLRWKYDTDSKIIGSVTIGADGTAYAGAEDRHLYAIDNAGRLKWKFKTDLPVRSTPTISPDGTIFFGSDDRHLYALFPNGKLKWKAGGGFFFTSSPLVTREGLVVTGCEDRYLYAFTGSGRLKWKFKTGGPVFSSPATAKDGTIYVGSQDYHLYALTPQGKQKWKFKTGHQVNSSPCVSPDGVIYVGSEDRCLYAVTPGGKLKWKVQTGNYITSSPAVSHGGDAVYVGSEDRSLWAVSNTGKVLWKFKTRGEVISSPTVDKNGVIYFGSDDGILYCVTPGGKKKWQFMTRDPVFSSPAIGADGTLFIGSEDGNIYAIGK